MEQNEKIFIEKLKMGYLSFTFKEQQIGALYENQNIWQYAIILYIRASKTSALLYAEMIF